MTQQEFMDMYRTDTMVVFDHAVASLVGVNEYDIAFTPLSKIYDTYQNRLYRIPVSLLEAVIAMAKED